MSDYLYEEEVVRGRSASPAQTAVSAKTLKLLKMLIILAIATIIAVVLQIAISPFLPARIEAQNIQGITRAELLETAGIVEGVSSYATIDAEATARSLLAISSIKTAVVKKKFFRIVQIEIETRKPIAQILASSVNKQIPLLIDEQGVVFAIRREFSATMPIITDPAMKEPVVGSRFSMPLVKLFASITKIAEEESLSMEPSLLARISEIEVHWRYSGTYDLILHLNHSLTRIFMKPELKISDLQDTIKVLDALTANGIRVHELDFRADVPVYR
jgi:cell division septal protein FtsQ